MAEYKKLEKVECSKPGTTWFTDGAFPFITDMENGTSIKWYPHKELERPMWDKMIELRKKYGITL